jgi:hypothetical protein
MAVLESVTDLAGRLLSYIPLIIGAVSSEI